MNIILIIEIQNKNNKNKFIKYINNIVLNKKSKTNIKLKKILFITFKFILKKYKECVCVLFVFKNSLTLVGFPQMKQSVHEVN